MTDPTESDLPRIQVRRGGIIFGGPVSDPPPGDYLLGGFRETRSDEGPVYEPVEPHPGETWADVGMRRLDAEAVEMRDEVLRRIGRALDLPESIMELDAGLVAAGSWCAPASSWYDLVDRTPWTHADLPWPWRMNVDRWLFPRLWRWQLARAEIRRRVGLAVGALRGAQVVEVDPDDEDDWLS